MDDSHARQRPTPSSGSGEPAPISHAGGGCHCVALRTGHLPRSPPERRAMCFLVDGRGAPSELRSIKQLQGDVTDQSRAWPPVPRCPEGNECHTLWCHGGRRASSRRQVGQAASNRAGNGRSASNVALPCIPSPWQQTLLYQGRHAFDQPRRGGVAGGAGHFPLQPLIGYERATLLHPDVGSVRRRSPP